LSTTLKTALVHGQNVLGFVEGSDPVLKNEVVVVGAHLDHLGRRGDYVFNGADDNGSGSVGVLNLARAFALNPEMPKRSVLFCLWTGEEEGLLGSRYYVQNPVFPLDKTVAYLNLDMISRPYEEKTLTRMARWIGLPTVQELIKKIKPANFLPVSFTSGAGLAEALRAADQSVGLDLFLRETGPAVDRESGGSDHSSFAAAKVPWLFAIAAMTEDYHQTSDNVEKISPELMEKISRLIYLTAFALADR
jgi:Zn-dependent M28 family amino/carboxypeptidase